LDFGTGPTEGEAVYNYVAPNETPQAVDFPGANAARKNDSGSQVNTFYYLRDASSYQTMGSAIKTLLSEVSLIYKFSPPELTYKFPFKVGDSWESVNDIVESGLATGTGRKEEQTKVIARSSVHVPQGDYAKCYLVQIREHAKYSSGEEITRIDYAWLVPGVGAVAYIYSVNGEQNEVFSQASSFWRLKFKGPTSRAHKHRVQMF